VRDEGLREARGGLEGREVAREAVVVVDAGERGVDDPRDGIGVGRHRLRLGFRG